MQKEAKANIVLENNVKITKKNLDEFGNDFEKTENGFTDFLLLDEKSFPFVIVEAKSEDKNPLDGKEQARKYARSQNVRFVILSNGNLHYFWDLERGNPSVITKFPTLESLHHTGSFQPNPSILVREIVGEDYIGYHCRTQSSRFIIEFGSETPRTMDGDDWLSLIK